MTFEIVITGIVSLVIGLTVGNGLGDQGTLRDCATQGTATLAGGGSITCDVVRKEKR